MSAATTTVATTLVPVPPPQPRRSKIVAVASTARIDRNVSQPMETSHEMTPGTFCPSTPNAARLSIMVGAEPRLPAIAMSPHSRNETMMPTTATSTPCQNEIPKYEDERGVAQPEDAHVGREPRPEQVGRARGAVRLVDDLDARRLDSEGAGLLQRAVAHVLIVPYAACARQRRDRSGEQRLAHVLARADPGRDRRRGRTRCAGGTPGGGPGSRGVSASGRSACAGRRRRPGRRARRRGGRAR